MIKIKREQFLKCINTIKNNNALYKVVKFIYKFVPFSIFLGYPILLCYLLFTKDIRIIKVIVIPLVTFIGVTIMRLLINRTRPYEKYNYTPVFPKDTKGKSFPSRHAASTFILSYAFLYINPVLGIISLSISLVMASLRPLCGVHYISDVVAGILISSVIGILFFFIF